MDIERLRMQGSSRLEELCAYLLPGGRKSGNRWVCGSIDGEKGSSFSVNLSTGVFGDYAVDDKMSQGAINLWMSAKHVQFKQACQELSQWMGSPGSFPIQVIEKVKVRLPCWLPSIRFPTSSEILHLATSRSVRPQSVEMAVKEGFLWMFDDEKNGACWLWTDFRRRCGLRRRLDGKPFVIKDGAESKSAACPNSIMTEPMGYLEAVSKPCFAVVEGGPDGLSVYDQAIALGKPLNIAPIVMPCSASGFTTASLKALEGKRGRIFSDNDAAGKKCSREWLKQLSSAGIKVDSYGFDAPMKDLNDFCKLGPAKSDIMSFALEKAPDVSPVEIRHITDECQYYPHLEGRDDQDMTESYYPDPD